MSVTCTDGRTIKSDGQAIEVFACIISIACTDGGMIKNDGKDIQVFATNITCMDSEQKQYCL